MFRQISDLTWWRGDDKMKGALLVVHPFSFSIMSFNTVKLQGSYGGDFTHAQSAWTSTKRDMTPEKIERIPKLLEMLSKAAMVSPMRPDLRSQSFTSLWSRISPHTFILSSTVSVSV